MGTLARIRGSNESSVKIFVRYYSVRAGRVIAGFGQEISTSSNDQGPQWRARRYVRSWPEAVIVNGGSRPTADIGRSRKRTLKPMEPGP